MKKIWKSAFPQTLFKALLFVCTRWQNYRGRQIDHLSALGKQITGNYFEVDVDKLKFLVVYTNTFY